jgi:two-component system response regulator YesN
MNILIVDDEVYITEGIRQSIDWAELEIENVYTAYSMKQAIDIFMQHEIDIIICDIQMPKGSGLDLLAWIRKQGYGTVCIFLTSYAIFDYANKAIRLESMDYVLKPIPYGELTKIIKKAVLKVKEQQINKKKDLMAKYWNDSQVKLAEQFWFRLAQGVIVPNINQISREAVGLYPDKPFLNLNYCPILLQLIPSSDEAREWEISLVEYALKNIIEETLFQNKDLSAISRMGNELYLVIIGVSPGNENKNDLAGQCKDVISCCSSILPYIITCYMSDFVKIDAIPQAAARLLSAMETKIPYENTVYILEEKTDAAADLNINELNQWIDDIFTGNFEATVEKVFHWLDIHAKNKTADRIMLKKLYHDFLQGIYIYLNKRQIQAHLLFQDEESLRITEQATRSIKDMKIWIDHTTRKALRFFEEVGSAASVIDMIKQYVREHLGEDLSRRDISDKVYLTPDYISHYFKERTGVSLTDYIRIERVKEAKKLLRTTNLTICEISLRVGYPSISYFSKIFKRSTGLTPQEYRKQKCSL